MLQRGPCFKISQSHGTNASIICHLSAAHLAIVWKEIWAHFVIAFPVQNLRRPLEGLLPCRWREEIHSSLRAVELSFTKGQAFQPLPRKLDETQCCASALLLDHIEYMVVALILTRVWKVCRPWSLIAPNWQGTQVSNMACCPLTLREPWAPRLKVGET